MCVREREAEVESCCSIFEIKAFASFLAIETEVLSFLALLQGNARVSLFLRERRRRRQQRAGERKRERGRAGEAGERERERRKDASQGKCDCPTTTTLNQSKQSLSIHLDVLVPSARRQQARRVEVEREHGLLRVPDDLERLGLHREREFFFRSSERNQKTKRSGADAAHTQKRAESLRASISLFVRPPLSLACARALILPPFARVA